MTSKNWTDSSLGGVNEVALASVTSPLIAPTSQNAGTMEGNQHAFAPDVPFTLPLGAGSGQDRELLAESQYTVTPYARTGNQAQMISKDGSGGSHPDTV